MSKAQLKLGLVGLGTIGTQVGTKLLEAGFPLMVLDLSQERVDFFVSRGAQAAHSGKELAAWADVVFMALPNSQCNEAAIMGDEGMFAGFGPGKILVDVGTSLPHETIRLSNLLLEKGTHMMDAPTSFGPEGMCFMVGGSEEDFAVVAPLLQHVGTPVTLMGAISQGHVTKLAQNMIRALNVAAVAEAFSFAVAGGVDPHKLWDAIRKSSSQSFALDKDAVLMAKRQHEGKGQVALHFKDNNYMLETGRFLGVSLPLTAEMNEIFKILVNRCGAATCSTAGFVRFYEYMNGIEVREQQL